MRKIFSLVLACVLSLTLWVNFAPAAQADLSQLTPCSESAAYQAKAKSFRNTTSDPQSGQKRAERYAEALCGEEGYPHLIVDGRLERAGDFLIPAVLFLYIAGWIGWVGRAYLIAIREEKDTEMREIIIDVPLAINKMLFGFLWPLQALQEFTSGQLTVKDAEIPISPR
jgi:photosystem I subunit 3